MRAGVTRGNAVASRAAKISSLLFAAVAVAIFGATTIPSTVTAGSSTLDQTAGHLDRGLARSLRGARDRMRRDPQ